MKMVDINKLFTEKVTEYLNKGYIFCPQSMSGHQGEIGKVDLIKDKVLIRIWLNSESSYNWLDDNAWHENIVVLRVSEWAYPADERLIVCDRTVWNSSLETIEEYKFYEISRNRWYVDSLEEALKIKNLRHERYYADRNSTGRIFKRVFTDDKAKTIASNYMKRVHGYRRIQWDKLAVNVSVASDLKNIYHIYYNGKGYKLS